MGNCSAKGSIVDCSVLHARMGRDGDGGGGVVRIMTETCRMIEYKCPVRVEDIIIPRHGIFRQGDVLTPLHDHEVLTDDQLYYLFPLVPPRRQQGTAGEVVKKRKGRRSEVLPSTGNGVWRVKLAINASQLADILSEEVNTEALIERMRIFASSPAQLR